MHFERAATAESSGLGGGQACVIPGRPWGSRTPLPAGHGQDPSGRKDHCSAVKGAPRATGGRVRAGAAGVSPLPPERKAGWRGVRRTPGAEGSCPRQATVAGPGSENAGPADSPAHPEGARSLPVIRASLPFTPSRHLTETTHSEDDLQPETVLGPAPTEGTGPRG